MVSTAEDAERPSMSVTVICEAKEPAVVGVPVNAPVALLKLRPGGIVPASPNVSGVWPPAATGEVS